MAMIGEGVENYKKQKEEEDKEKLAKELAASLQKQCKGECGDSHCCVYIQDYELKSERKPNSMMHKMRGNKLINAKVLAKQFPFLKENNILLIHNPCKWISSTGCTNKKKPEVFCGEFPDKQQWIDYKAPLVLPTKCKFATEADILVNNKLQMITDKNNIK